MKTYATVTGSRGAVKLVFGIYGLKHFCKRMGCEPAIFSVLSAFQGGTRLEATAEIIRCGVEQASVDADGTVVTFSDYEACEILETATEKEAEAAMKAFFSSIVGEDYDEWFKKLEADAEPTPTETTDTDEKKASPQLGRNRVGSLRRNRLKTQ